MARPKDASLESGDGDPTFDKPRMFCFPKQSAPVHSDSEDLAYLLEVDGISLPVKDDIQCGLPCAINKLRVLALAEGLKMQRDEGPITRAKNAGYAYIRFLTDHTLDTHYLQACLIEDETFYRGTNSKEGTKSKDLRPKKQEEWTKGWHNALPWLDRSSRRPLAKLKALVRKQGKPACPTRAEQLTIAELELALTIFEWKAKGPEFVWWIKKHPYILRRVHRFLLHRYCWPLLDAYYKAAGPPCTCEYNKSPKGQLKKPDDLYRAPYRATEFPRWHLRIVAFNAVGGVAAAGQFDLGLPHAFFSLAPILPLAAVAIFLTLIWLMAYQDVFNQNHGLLDSWKHAFPRVWGLCWRMFVPGFIIGVLIVSAYAWFAPDETRIAMPEGLCGWLSFLLATLAVGLTVTTLGALINWLWDEYAATDPL